MLEKLNKLPEFTSDVLSCTEVSLHNIFLDSPIFEKLLTVLGFPVWDDGAHSGSVMDNWKRAAGTQLRIRLVSHLSMH